MLSKKLGALLLATTMALFCIPGKMATAEKSAWFDLEVETGSGVVTVDTNIETGRKFMVSQLYNSANRGSSSTMTFEVSFSANYDIWAVMSASNWNYVGGSEYTLDGTDVLWSGDWGTAYAQAASDVLYKTGDLAGTNYHMAEMRWVKIASNKAISLGEHTLKATAVKASNGNDAAAMDVVRIVPSAWNWTPGNNFDAPVQPEWVNLKIKEATLSEGDFDGKHPTLAQVDEMYVAKRDTDGATADWTFEVPLTNSYDVWVLCDDFSGEHESRRFLTINSDAQIEIPKSGVLAYKSSIATGWSMGYIADYTFNLNWIKVTTKDFVAGEANAIRWSCLPRRIVIDGNLTAVHSVRLVPSEWSWVPTADDVTLAAPYDMTPTPTPDIPEVPDVPDRDENTASVEIIGATSTEDTLKFISEATIEGEPEITAFGTTFIPLWLFEAGSADVATVEYENSKYNITNGQTYGATLTNIPEFCKNMDIVGKSYIKDADGMYIWSAAKYSSAENPTLNSIE